MRRVVVANNSMPSNHAIKSSNPTVTAPASMAGLNQTISVTADRCTHSLPTGSAQIRDSGIDVEPSFSHNFVTSARYSTFDVNFYCGGASTGVPLLSWPDTKRENGWDSSASDGADHHSLTVVTGANPCHFYELYNDVISPADVYNCQDGSSGCGAQSGDDFSPASYDHIAGSDAAGLPQYLVLRLDEIKNNTIHHPTRFTLSRGLIQGPAAEPRTSGLQRVRTGGEIRIRCHSAHGCAYARTIRWQYVTVCAEYFDFV